VPLKPHPHMEDLHRTVGEFRQKVLEDTFLTTYDVGKICHEIAEAEMKKGKHSKFLSRKHCARLNGKIVAKHVPKKKTYVMVEFAVESRKRSRFTFAAFNYFDTPRGRIYVFRGGMTYPPLSFFTGHFFDRLGERGYRDDLNRLSLLHRMLSAASRTETGMLESALVDVETDECFLPLLGGLGLGVFDVSDWDDAFGFPPYKQDRPKQIPVSLYLTYVGEQQLLQKQKDLLASRSQSRKAPPLFAGPLLEPKTDYYRKE
jgi:hypothetical protein